MPVPGGSGPYQPGKFYVPAAPVDAAAVPAIGVDADSLALAELSAALTADVLGSDLAALVESVQASLPIVGVDGLTVSEATSVTSAISATESATLAESAVAALGTISQDVSDIEPLLLVEIEALLAEVAHPDSIALAEDSDPPPIAPPVGRPDIELFHVAGIHPLPVLGPMADDDAGLTLAASAWLTWYD